MPLKQWIKRTPIYPGLRWLKERRELRLWEQRGRPAPPPHIIKQRTIERYAADFGLRVMVETGTYYGDMVDAMRDRFDRIYSIELSDQLYRQAQRRFAGDERITLIQGDSGVELGKLVAGLEEAALFWLDGHYSGGVTAKGQLETPIFAELDHIFRSPVPGHVILIDDARCFGGDPGYPGMEALRDFVHRTAPGAGIEVADDSIRITPAPQPA